MKNLRTLTSTAILATAIIVTGASGVAADQSASKMHKMGSHKAVHTNAVYETKNALRDLWTGHIFWVRAVVVAHLNGNEKAEMAAEAQVVANVKMIAGSIRPFYGAGAEAGLMDLLVGHYGGIKAYLVATKIGNEKNQDRAVETLLENAEKIAVFLSGANPYLPKEAVLSLYVTHGTHHTAQIRAFFEHEYTDEAEIWMHMTKHMYVIADATADALAKQFPEKF